MVKITALSLTLLLTATVPALASRHGGGGHHSGGRHYGHSSTFRTSYCKSASCYRKHPDGKYVHPITPRKHR